MIFVDDHPLKHGVVLNRIERDARKVWGFLIPDIGAASLQEEVEGAKNCREHYKVSQNSAGPLLRERGQTGFGSAEVVDCNVEERYTTCGGKAIDLRWKDREEVKEMIPEEACGQVM